MQPSGNHGHGLTAESNCDHGRATRASISAQGTPSHDISRLRRRRCRGRRAIRRQILIIVLVLVWRQPLDDCVFLVRGRFLLGAREIGRRPRATQAAEAAEAALWCLQQRPAALPALPGSTRHHDGRGGQARGGRTGGGGLLYQRRDALALVVGVRVRVIVFALLALHLASSGRALRRVLR